jgi:hypothetical protein
VVCSGYPDEIVHNLFDGITDEFTAYNGSGRDIGAHQNVTRDSNADLVVCMGTTAYFFKKGWLERLAAAYQEFGDGLYGPMGSNENHPHIRTACFAFTPGMMKRYPYVIDSRNKSIDFESGPLNPDWGFTAWTHSQGFPVKMVTWDAFYDQQDWRKPDNIFRRGDQSNCMVWDRHTDIYACSDYHTQKELSRRSDLGR